MSISMIVENLIDRLCAAKSTIGSLSEQLLRKEDECVALQREVDRETLRAEKAVCELRELRDRTPTHTMTVEAVHMLRSFSQKNNRMGALKAVRTLTGFGLREAKNVIDEVEPYVETIDHVA